MYPIHTNRFIAGNVWLKEWSESNTKHGSNAMTGKYIGVYFAFGFGAAALVMAQTLILWLLCAIEVCSFRDTLLTRALSIHCSPGSENLAP